MKQEDIGVEMRVHIARKYVTMTAAAKEWGVSTAFVSAVVNGHKRPNQAMLDDMGLERVETPDIYRKKKGVKA